MPLRGIWARLAARLRGFPRPAMGLPGNPAGRLYSAGLSSWSRSTAAAMAL
jgi:hypothetical protein